MFNSVNLYLASGVSNGIGFWVVNFTEHDDIINSPDSKFLECYRKELFGIDSAIEVMEAINSTLDILSLNSKFDRYKIFDSSIAYSSEIPLYIMEDIFDLWAYNYGDQFLWNKYIGLLNLRKRVRIYNNYINIGLKGNTFDFAIKLDKLLRFSPINSFSSKNKSNKLMW